MLPQYGSPKEGKVITGIPECCPECLWNNTNFLPCCPSLIRLHYGTQNNHDIFVRTILYNSQFSHMLSHLTLTNLVRLRQQRFLSTQFIITILRLKRITWLTQWVYKRARTKSWDLEFTGQDLSLHVPPQSLVLKGRNGPVLGKHVMGILWIFGHKRSVKVHVRVYTYVGKLPEHKRDIHHHLT